MTGAAIPRVNMGDMAWRDHGACKGVDGDLFFPERGQTKQIKQAKAICATCPVQAECLEFALKNVERFGVWGGKSELERRTLRKQRHATKIAEAELRAEAGMKLCLKCETVKQLEAFPKDKTMSDGRNGNCRACRQIYNRRRPKAA